MPNRRDFLKTGTVVAGASAVAGSDSELDAKPKSKVKNGSFRDKLLEGLGGCLHQRDLAALG